MMTHEGLTVVHVDLIKKNECPRYDDRKSIEHSAPQRECANGPFSMVLHREWMQAGHQVRKDNKISCHVGTNGPILKTFIKANGIGDDLPGVQWHNKATQESGPSSPRRQ